MRESDAAPGSRDVNRNVLQSLRSGPGRYLLTNVTRFGKISPLWRKLKCLKQIYESLFSIWQILTLTNLLPVRHWRAGERLGWRKPRSGHDPEIKSGQQISGQRRNHRIRCSHRRDPKHQGRLQRPQIWSGKLGRIIDVKKSVLLYSTLGFKVWLGKQHRWKLVCVMDKK